MAHPDLAARISGLFLGAAKTRWEGKPPSAIQKEKVTGSQNITRTGFSGDEQADLMVHGGAEKAIHHYASDHYDAWQSEGHMAADTCPAAFGENISTRGLTEDNLCIGDILTLGTATVQISQGRQPCWKLGLHTGNEKMPYLFQKTGRTGWYYRVLEPGIAAPGDLISLLERRHTDWSVRRVTQARLTRRISPQEAEILANTKDLAQGWRKAFARMADGISEEDNSTRLGT
ncbi:MOSC domain-containing protein [uncultured Roseobacter sp.]|uniref:MOSC domain-containing protein n=1 Tax=uncultured Roseobacter sp. TaxID=114847 RepID=UPI00262E198B|nr:MOSC domain-containing protein [uncultured Roseobacter sp.]